MIHFLQQPLQSHDTWLWEYDRLEQNFKIPTGKIQVKSALKNNLQMITPKNHV